VSRGTLLTFLATFLLFAEPKEMQSRELESRCKTQQQKIHEGYTMKVLIHPLPRIALGMTALLLMQNPLPAAPPTDKELVHQIFDTMVQIHGVKPGFRLVHAKGVVCEGNFMPSKAAAGLSKAAHFQKGPVPVVIRFSDGSADPGIPDYSPDAGPRGMAIKFKIPGSEDTDIVAMSHNGFVVGTPEEFLALQKSVVATDPSKPHPWPVEEFIGSHPLALKFVKENQVASASYATQEFFSNDSFVFVNKDGKKQAGRYKIVPVAGQHNLTEAEAKAKSPGYLAEDLKARLATKPVRYSLIVQLPNDGDSTKDPSIVWPDDRKTVVLGLINIISVNPDSAAAEKPLAFAPGNLTDGIDFSDDPFPELRSAVYSLSVKRRHQTQ
jgi:catalase